MIPCFEALYCVDRPVLAWMKLIPQPEDKDHQTESKPNQCCQTTAVLKGCTELFFNVTALLKITPGRVHAALQGKWCTVYFFLKQNVLCLLTQSPNGFPLLPACKDLQAATLTLTAEAILQKERASQWKTLSMFLLKLQYCLNLIKAAWRANSAAYV